VNRHHHQVATYTGAGMAYTPPGYAPPGYAQGHAPHGFCESCCHPVARCCCHRQCRKEARELLVQPTLKAGEVANDPALAGILARAAVFRSNQAVVGQAQLEAAQQAAPAIGIGKAFIGGACCVYLSVEYTPQTPTAASAVLVLADDSEGTVLAWGKSEQPGASYRIKECIITTKPGADLSVLVVNMTARVRWCEIFSC